MYKSIGFIGTGNMGGAMAAAAANSGLAERILLANRTPKHRLWQISCLGQSCRATPPSPGNVSSFSWG